MLNLTEGVRGALLAELTGLQQRVAGLRVWVVGGMDGLLFLHSGRGGAEPHDLAALAAAALGVGRQTGMSLRQGAFRECTIHSERGYFSVYALGDSTLLALAGDDGINVARLHLEVRTLAPRLVAILNSAGDQLFVHAPLSVEQL